MTDPSSSPSQFSRVQRSFTWSGVGKWLKMGTERSTVTDPLNDLTDQQVIDSLPPKSQDDKRSNNPDPINNMSDNELRKIVKRNRNRRNSLTALETQILRRNTTGAESSLLNTDPVNLSTRTDYNYSHHPSRSVSQQKGPSRGTVERDHFHKKYINSAAKEPAVSQRKTTRGERGPPSTDTGIGRSSHTTDLTAISLSELDRQRKLREPELKLVHPPMENSLNLPVPTRQISSWNWTSTNNSPSFVVAPPEQSLVPCRIISQPLPGKEAPVVHRTRYRGIKSPKKFESGEEGESIEVIPEMHAAKDGDREVEPQGKGDGDVLPSRYRAAGGYSGRNVVPRPGR